MMTLLQVDTTEQRLNEYDDHDDDSDDHDDNDDNDDDDDDDNDDNDDNDDDSDDHDDVDAGGLVHDRAEGEQRPGHNQRAQERACLSCCFATRGHGEYFCRNKGAWNVFLSQQGGMVSVLIATRAVVTLFVTPEGIRRR